MDREVAIEAGIGQDGNVHLHAMHAGARQLKQGGMRKAQKTHSKATPGKHVIGKSSDADGRRSSMPRKRNNQCVCEQVTLQGTASGMCKKLEDQYGQSHWLYGSMYQLPPKNAERYGINMRKRWLKHLGLTENELEEQSVAKPEVRWTHFPQSFFKKDKADEDDSKPRRRRLKYVVERQSTMFEEDIITTGKHSGMAVPVPLNKFAGQPADSIAPITALDRKVVLPYPSAGVIDLSFGTDLFKLSLVSEELERMMNNLQAVRQWEETQIEALHKKSKELFECNAEAITRIAAQVENTKNPKSYLNAMLKQ